MPGLSKKLSLCPMKGLSISMENINSGKISRDNKALLSTNQLDVGADLSFSDCKKIFPALRRAKPVGDKIHKIHTPPPNSLESQDRGWVPAEPGKPVLIGVGMMRLIWGDFSYAVHSNTWLLLLFSHQC